MLLNYMKGKIHRATVTQADLNYEGSVTIDELLMQASGIQPYEQVHVYNVTNGERFVTYAITGPSESGVICLNGAAARLVSPGDKVIIVAYCQVTSEESKDFRPKVVLVDEQNRIKDSFSVRAGEPKPAGAPLIDRR
jgi:aspartate 1-decarboxylase